MGSKTKKSCTGDNVLPHYKITDQRLEEQMKKTCIEQDCYYVLIFEHRLNVSFAWFIGQCYFDYTPDESIKRKIIQQILLKSG